MIKNVRDQKSTAVSLLFMHTRLIWFRTHRTGKSRPPFFFLEKHTSIARHFCLKFQVLVLLTMSVTHHKGHNKLTFWSHIKIKVTSLIMEAGIYDQLAMNKKHRTDSSKYWVTRAVLMHGFGKTSLVFSQMIRWF